MARGLKFRIYKVEGLYYLSSENKGADQLRGHREVDLRLCLCIYAKRLFSHDATQMIFRSANSVLILWSQLAPMATMLRHKWCHWGKALKVVTADNTCTGTMSSTFDT